MHDATAEHHQEGALLGGLVVVCEGRPKRQVGDLLLQGHVVQQLQHRTALAKKGYGTVPRYDLCTDQLFQEEKLYVLLTSVVINHYPA